MGYPVIKILTLKKIKNIFWWGSREISFDSEEVSVNTKNWLVGIQVKRFRLDQINPRYEIRSSYFGSISNFILLFAFLIILFNSFFNLFSIEGLLYLASFLLLMSLLRILVNSRTVEFKSRNDFFTISMNRLNERKVSTFIGCLESETKHYFVKKFGFIDPDLPQESQFENYRWLLQNHIITEKEYKALKDKLKTKILEKKD